MSGDTIHTLNISDSLNNLYLKPIHVSGDSLFLIGSVGSTKQFEPNEGVFIAYNHKTNSVIFKRIFNKHPNYNTNLWHGVFNEKKQTFLIAGTAQIDTTSSNFLQLFLIECNTNGLAINMYSMSDTVDYSYLQLATSKKSGKIFCGVEKFSANQKSSFIYFTLDSLNNKVISKRIYDGIQDKLFFTNAFIDSTDNILLSLGPRILNIDSIGDIIGYNYIFQNNTYPLANILYKAGTVIGNKAYFIGSVKLLLSSAFDIIIAETDLNGIGCFASNLTESSVNYPIAINPDSISIYKSTSFHCN